MKDKVKEYLYNYTSEEKSYLVEDYPWGFRLRTKKRYWIETQDKSTGGQRFCSQTLDPKTGYWCKPKKGTYSPIKIMYITDNGYVDHVTVEFNDYGNGCDQAKIDNFFAEHKDRLTEYQIKTLQKIKAHRKAMSGIKWVIKEVKAGEF